MRKTPNSSLTFRYNANNEELEELYRVCDDDPPTPQCDPPSSAQSENASPKRGDKSSSSILDKYFKSMRAEKVDKSEDAKNVEAKGSEETKTTPQKEITASPMKEYLNRLGKRSTSETSQDKDSNETWKIFHDFKFKIAQAVEDMKTRSVEETKEKSVPRENSTSDSEENSAVKDVDQQSVGDTDNQVSSLDSSIQNLSEMTQPLTAKATEREASLPADNKNSESSDDTHKNLALSESDDISKDFLNDSNLLEVESGVEALEDTLDGYADVPHTEGEDRNILQNADKTPPQLPSRDSPTSFGLPPSKTNITNSQEEIVPKTYFFTFSMYFLTFLLFFNFLLFPKWNIWNGFLLGLWFFSFFSICKQWLLDNYFSDDPKSSFFQMKRSSLTPLTYTIPSVKEHTPLKKYEGWINHYRYPDYDPFTYTITKTTTAFMKLEGCNLRISYTRTKVSKKALWDEKIENVVFYQHRLYNLTGARVILLPKGLVRRRQWSKKYPICIILSESEKIQVLEKETGLGDKKPSESVTDKKSKEQQHEVETVETNTSPEKKRKFVWRRREKSITHTDSETGKEGLRHRFVRKMHRDKKPDNIPITTEPAESQTQVNPPEKLEEPFHDAEADLSTKSVTSTKEEDEELDETELSRIKECLEEAVSKKSCMVGKKEAEAGPDAMAEGEWSVHVKQSRDKHSLLYLFTRTGRDKIEWFRRLSTAIAEANASADASPTEDKSGSEPEKEVSEHAFYRISDMNTVSFAKSNKSCESVSENVTISSSTSAQPSMESYEKNFWPYILKIIQNKSQSPTTECQMLPADVLWVNTVLARIMYDVMSDSAIIARLQNRIQRKLNTLKLPSFMSPLCVREVSLRGACPLLSRVSRPHCDAQGVWIDADLRYDGGAHIALFTQINLLKLKEKSVTLEDHILGAADEYLEKELSGGASSNYFEQRRRKLAVYDSEVEDSAESSSDDDAVSVQPVDSTDNFPAPDSAPNVTEGSSSKKKFLRMVDKIATNKYFQQVTDYKYVKRAMEGLSNTDIKLQVEVQALSGRLTLNLPPPPHDRVWVGFRTNPQLVLKAKPAVGARALRFAHISNWIEQKLSKEFEKILVLPNMEDIIIDIMTPTPVDYE
ncbi:testis-expressed protein 2 isoform X2 [Plodia interpunctella]|uniref:testis-expressed protein 2 isoform X2 n=1 Tax=Plodia interpunctella TaxID=58824 RepID=UPI0023689EBC|nr:testis-expressed protein 2 isoform X2 [Plodia interpunctella]